MSVAMGLQPDRRQRRGGGLKVLRSGMQFDVLSPMRCWAARWMGSTSAMGALRLQPGLGGGLHLGTMDEQMGGAGAACGGGDAAEAL
jgi:hypothetical protein